MVKLKDERAVTAKIIDLGLAKPATGDPPDLAISLLGAFVGTPEFASPEQFAGIGVDIRSDLYSLGITLWEMLTGQTPFRGDYTQVMCQHQHALLPFGQLEGVPQPVVVLIEVLLAKDPARRFQNPTELLKAMPTIIRAIGSGGAITHERFQNEPVATSRVAGRTPAGPGPAKIFVARLPVTGGNLFGREQDIDFLDDAWANQEINVVMFGVKSFLDGSTTTMIGLTTASPTLGLSWCTHLPEKSVYRFSLAEIG